MKCPNTIYDTPKWLNDFYLRRNLYIHCQDNYMDYFLDEVPPTLKDKICKCHSWQTKGSKLILDQYLSYCGRCRLLLTHYLTICVNCRNKFIKDFKHPAYCIWMPYCWDCVQMNPDVICEEPVGYVQPLIPPRLTRIKPLPEYDFGEDGLTFTLD